MSERIVGIDASRMLAGQRTGTENYTFNLVQSLLGRPSSHRYRLYLNARRLPDDLAIDAEVRGIPAPRLWTHVRLSVEMVQHPPDLLFVPAHVVPLRHPKTVVTVHDLGYLHHPESHPTHQRLMLDWSTRWSVRAATHVVAPSDATALDLLNHYRVPASHVSVIHHGVSQRFIPAPDGEVARVRQRHGLHRPYILTVGTVQPRKNYERLAQAVKMMLASGIDTDLVIAGKRGWMADQVERALASSGLNDRLRQVSYVPDDDLPALYTGAEVFAMPSLYEGFGLPLLEAMACRTPTVAANRSSLPEIAGDASVLFDPLSTEDCARALQLVLERPELSARLRRAGIARASTFTWESAADHTASLFDRLLPGPRN